MSTLSALQAFYEIQMMRLPWKIRHPIGRYVEALEAERDSLRTERETLKRAHEYVSLGRTRYRQERNEARAEVEQLRNALREVADVGDRASFRVARRALAISAARAAREALEGSERGA